MPHKIKVIPYLDELSPAAEIIGAVILSFRRTADYMEKIQTARVL